MNTKIIKALYKKEILDIVRDKKTLLMMIVVPLVLYPLIFIASMTLTSMILTQSTHNSYHIAIDKDVKNAESLKSYINGFAPDYEYDFIFVDNFENLQIEDSKDNKVVINSLEDALKAKIVDAYITRADSGEEKEHYVIHYMSSVNDSATAREMLYDMLGEYQKKISRLKVEGADLDPVYIFDAISYESEDLSSTEESVGSLFGYIIPFLMVSSILMGAMYPAIDTTAGEKERGTLETLLTLPVNNLELIISKFLATTSMAMVAALLNVVSMGVLGAYFYQTLNLSDGATTFSTASYIPAILITLLCALVFGMFASAVCLLVCIFAKSFKEAQNYSTPVMMVFMFSAMASMIPGINLEGVLAYVPIINVSLLIGKLFVFEFDISVIMIVLFSNVLYSLIAVVIMARVFCSESILFSDGSEGIRIIEKRSDMAEKQIPGIGDVLLLFSILLIVLMMAGSLLILKLGLPGLIIEQLLIFGLTVFYCWYIKTDFRKVFSLNRPSVSGIVSGILMWFGVYTLMMLLTALLSKIMPESAANAGDELTLILDNQPLWIIILTAAVLPAICEEIAFRGFLFGTLSNRYKIIPAIIWTGVIFGAYHMNLVKLMVVGLLGGFMAFAVYKTGSIATSMTMHLLNNSVALIMGLYGEQLADKLPLLFKEDLSTIEIVGLVVIGIICLALSVVWMNYIQNRRISLAVDKEVVMIDGENQ